MNKMKQVEQICLWDQKEYQYDPTTDFIPNLRVYLQDTEVRAMIMIVPGGAYSMPSPLEAEIAAARFFKEGYHVCVLNYTNNAMGLRKPVLKQALQDIARAMRILRKESQRLRISPDQIAVCGFSAGGHLAAALAVHARKNWMRERQRSELGQKISPDALILSYPLLSMREYSNEASRQNLLGKYPEERMIEEMSLENQANCFVPKTFIWHSIKDKAVRVENSLLFANSLQAKKVEYELHIYSHGEHGISIADESVWCYQIDPNSPALEQLKKVFEYERFVNKRKEIHGIEIEHLKSWDEFARLRFNKNMRSVKNTFISAWVECCLTWLRGCFFEENI